MRNWNEEDEKEGQSQFRCSTLNDSSQKKDIADLNYIETEVLATDLEDSLHKHHELKERFRLKGKKLAFTGLSGSH